MVGTKTDGLGGKKTGIRRIKTTPRKYLFWWTLKEAGTGRNWHGSLNQEGLWVGGGV